VIEPATGTTLGGRRRNALRRDRRLARARKRLDAREGVVRNLGHDQGTARSRRAAVARSVVGVISPFNFPLYLAMRSGAPSLALGNAVKRWTGMTPNEVRGNADPAPRSSSMAG